MPCSSWWVASLVLVLSVFTCFLLFCVILFYYFFVFCVSCRISSRGALPRCVSILPQARGILTSSRRSSLAGVFIFVLLLCSFSCFLFVIFLPLFLSFNIFGLLACACCACRIQNDGMALHCLLLVTASRCSISLCRSFVTTRACISLRMKNQHIGHAVCWVSTGRKNGFM